MPSFDVVSEVDMHEVTNAVDQASREVETRFDFKGTGSHFERDDASITMVSESDFQLKQMLEILRSKLAKRGVDVRALEVMPAQLVGQQARQTVQVRHGIDKDMSRAVVKSIKDSKLKVQTQIQGEQVRVIGKKRDDLQNVIAHLKSGDFAIPLQFTNFRD